MHEMIWHNLELNQQLENLMSGHEKAGYPKTLLLAKSTQSLNDSFSSLTTSFNGSSILFLQAKKCGVNFLFLSFS